MLTQLNIQLEHCYGIKKLHHTFDFSRGRVQALYAPNGTMKTSFAKTLKDLSGNQASLDQVFRERPCKREIKDGLGNDLLPGQVFVIEPYVESYRSDKVATLLVNPLLKARYEAILKHIDTEKNLLLTKLKQLSGLTGRTFTVESELSKLFGNSSFLEVLLGLEHQVNAQHGHPFSSIVYARIFEEKVVTFLNTKDFKRQIKAYIERYNTLLESSRYLKKGFNHSNVTEIQKTLRGNGFFQANHSVNLFNGTTNDRISNEEELQEIISKEIETVLQDSEIQKKFHEIDAKLTTVQLKEFREYLFDNKFILPELAQMDNFRKEIWYSYLVEQKALFNNLLAVYKEGKSEIEGIIQAAKQEETDWKEVIDIFNKRFSVPFELEIRNKEDVILKSDSPTLQFVFRDYSLPEKKGVEENVLLSVLSQGEKRALYLLNIIFEVTARKKAGQETVFIVDDIADSFDYKNKYAIVEYLKEISEEPLFSQVILTHNFDFFRTVQSRLLGESLKRDNSYLVLRNDTELQLVSAGHKNITSPFEDWKKNLQNPAVLVATIPFIRNLVEYREGSASGHFGTLTSLLHIKPDTPAITVATLKGIYGDILLNPEFGDHDDHKRVVDIISEAAEAICLEADDNSVNLENKITLSIAIRLNAERYMWAKVSDQAPIRGNQTGKLFERYKIEFKADDRHKQPIKLCEQVNLMTPENIHLNSFMYEPILDMANIHLKQLYLNIKVLLATAGVQTEAVIPAVPDIAV